jgi:predicted AlkP superfamily pyrophosphatase or phosphodiesterase
MRVTRRALFLLLLIVAGFAHAQPASRPYVVLVSLDGFRYDYAERYHAANLLSIRDNGASAPFMIPCFPSVTFPNHLSIVTGLYPEHHGLVGNSFYDPARDASYGMSTTSTDGSWYSGTPLWMLAEQQGVRAASMFWPTSDATWRGFKLPLSFAYDGRVPNEQRVQQVLDWLRLPEAARPHFITVYFSDVDHAGHTYGPEAPETRAAVEQIDQIIGRLHAGLQALSLPVNLIVVSDHGMQTVDDGEVDLSPYVDAATTRVVLNGPVAFIYAHDPANVEKAYRALKGKDRRFEVYRRSETPAEWHFRENPRGGDLVALVNQAAVFVMPRPDRDKDGKAKAPRPPPKGEHGYDPRKFKTMHAIFYATGPNVKPKGRVDSFENVNVYPFIARILGLKLPEKLDGSPGVLDPLYRP